VLALTQFLMVWILGGLYLRRADRDFDPLARRTAEKALEVGSVSPAPGSAPTGTAGPAAAPGDRPTGGEVREP
jgi:hypothetical protein